MEPRTFFLKAFESYGALSAESQKALENILTERQYKRHEFFIQAGERPEQIAFVCKGLFSQYYTSEEGDVIVKRFFPEGFHCTSLSALLSKSPSNFTIKALEDTSVLQYSYEAFRRLIKTHSDIAEAYIRYLEVHWIIEKEPLEISLRYETATSRYLTFLKEYPSLEPRLKQHEIAAYLGVTPTQLSRIRAEL